MPRLSLLVLWHICNQSPQPVANKVAARNHARLDLVRVLGDIGFVCAFVIGGGFYLGTTQPSVSDIEQELTHEVRLVAPAAKVDLITQDETSGSGLTSRRLIFRFRLRDGDGRGVTP